MKVLLAQNSEFRRGRRGRRSRTQYFSTKSQILEIRLFHTEGILPSKRHQSVWVLLHHFFLSLVEVCPYSTRFFESFQVSEEVIMGGAYVEGSQIRVMLLGFFNLCLMQLLQSVWVPLHLPQDDVRGENSVPLNDVLQSYISDEANEQKLRVFHVDGSQVKRPESFGVLLLPVHRQEPLFQERKREMVACA